MKCPNKFMHRQDATSLSHTINRLSLAVTLLGGIGLTQMGCNDNESQSTDDDTTQSQSVPTGCQPERNETGFGLRCYYPSSEESLALNTLIFVDDETPVLIEAWGGAGGNGYCSECDDLSTSLESGRGGVGGYAMTAQTWSDLNAAEALWLYVGGEGERGQGGTASLVITEDIQYVVNDIDGTGVMAIAGGGGGGGIYNDDGDGSSSGGDGAVMSAKVGTQPAVTTAAGDGAAYGSLEGGSGGGTEKAGVGGLGTDGDNENPGTNGVGGMGGKETGWLGLSDITWVDGHGGLPICGVNQDCGGGGGGGYGGGGGGDKKDSATGGGGGGSWIRDLSASITTMPGIGVYGQSTWTEGDGLIVLSFDATYCFFDASSVLRCAFGGSATFDLEGFVTLFNAQGLSETITNDTPVYFEAWGGNGGDGGISDSGDGGTGGVGGYAFTAQTYGGLVSMIDHQNSDGLYIYAGAAGADGEAAADTNGGGGGAASMVMIDAVTSITDSDNPGGEYVILIAGGGGGAGGGGTDKVTGGDGGAGAQALATASAVGNITGDPGKASSGSNSEGQGGGTTGQQGCTGTGSTGCGKSGIGGLGGDDGSGAKAGWLYSTIDSSDWYYGEGGDPATAVTGSSSRIGGGGGGGFGGGGAGGFNSTTSAGDGGGGGSSYARIFNSAITTDSKLLLTDNPFTDGSGAVFLTFDLSN